MHPYSVSNMFNFTYEKSASEIIAKAKTKIEFLGKMIEERQARIRQMREEHKIDDGALVELLTEARRAAQRNEGRLSFSYTSKVPQGQGSTGPEERTIGAGTVNFLLTESDFLENEKDQAKRLGYIVRNLRDLPDSRITSLMPGAERPLRGHELSYAELEFFGF